MTGRERAKTVTDGVERTETEVEPLSNYLVVRAQREITERGAIGVLATAVNRDLLGAGAATTICRRRRTSAASTGTISSTANATGWSHGRIAGSQLPGSTSAISRLQQASQRYFQRPDAAHLELDPAATSLAAGRAA